MKYIPTKQATTSVSIVVITMSLSMKLSNAGKVCTTAPIRNSVRKNLNMKMSTVAIYYLLLAIRAVYTPSVLIL